MTVTANPYGSSFRLAAVVYATRGLIEALLGFARERDPDPVTITLAVTSAATLDEADLTSEASVFTHFYLPDAGASVRAVFGIDLGTPAGQTPGVFVSHPDGTSEPERTDVFREVVFIAIPPWDVDSVTAFGRDGRRREVVLLDIDLPSESPP